MIVFQMPPFPTLKVMIWMAVMQYHFELRKMVHDHFFSRDISMSFIYNIKCKKIMIAMNPKGYIVSLPSSSTSMNPPK